MLRHLVIASAVWAHWRVLASDTVQVAGQKRRVACSQLSDSDALASGPAESPVCLWIGLSSQGAMCGWVRVVHVAGVELLLTRPPNQNLCRCCSKPCLVYYPLLNSPSSSMLHLLFRFPSHSSLFFQIFHLFQSISSRLPARSVKLTYITQQSRMRKARISIFRLLCEKKWWMTLRYTSLQLPQVHSMHGSANMRLSTNRLN